MKGIITLLAAATSLDLCAAVGDALPRDAPAGALSLVNRALPNSPSGGYAPAAVDCPSTRPTIRSASSLSPDETSWLELRRNNTVEPLSSWLSRMNISGFDAAGYINTHKNNATALPNIGIAFSGGGYRALLNGAGFLAAVDNRTQNATNTGQIGGLLQATTYLAGLSGGSWLVGSVYTNNFSSIETLRDGHSGSSIWKFGNSIFEGPDTGKNQIVSSVSYFQSISDQVKSKANSPLGLNTSITDYWGRALSYQLVDAPDGGPSYTFSSIALSDNFKNGQIPFPTIVADERSPNTNIVSINSTLYEFNPFEMGSWDPTLYGFAPTEFLGSNFSGGSIPDGQQCVRGFDQAGFIMGTSSTLFNQFLLNINTTSIPSFLRTIFTDILQSVGEDNDDIAQYQPNPFSNFNNATNRNAQASELTLVDGGEDNQNIPLNPLIQPNRNVDVIYAVDSSADTIYSWPNGSSLVWTYRRSLNHTIQNGTGFPSIPDVNTFINLGLNTHPTFFGCDASNITGSSPLIVYIPNAPYIFNSNVSTFTPSYNNSERNAIIENGFDAGTLGNGTLDRDWPTCMACAALSRSFTKTGTTVPAACTTCFQRYCWNGTVDSREPTGNYTPPFKLKELKISSAAPAGATAVRTTAYLGALVAATLIVLV